MFPQFTIPEYNFICRFFKFNGFNKNLQQSDLFLIRELMEIQLSDSPMAKEIISKILDWEATMSVEAMLAGEYDIVDNESQLTLDALEDNLR